MSVKTFVGTSQHGETTAKTIWVRWVWYEGREVAIDGELGDCPHPSDALSVVCDDPVYGDNRVMCHACGGIESR